MRIIAVWVCSDTWQDDLVLGLIQRIILVALMLQMRNMIAYLRRVQVELICTRHHIDDLSLVKQCLHLILLVCRYRLGA